LTETERTLVSRWGYDPISSGVAVPPLCLDDLTNQIGFLPYQSLGSKVDAEGRYAGIALHRVEFDSDKDLWYADIGFRTFFSSRPIAQLAMARYQASALSGLELSDIEQFDPIALPGNREVKISRAQGGSGRLKVALTGPFEPIRFRLGASRIICA
jgi:hypothetical protein